MLSSTPLQSTLRDLDSLYNASSVGSGQQDYFAKLALIELCGWIEECIDEMARDYCTAIRDVEQLENILKRIHGFNYDNLRSVMVQIAGITKVVEAEYQLQNKGVSYTLLNTQLAALSKKRNDAAHSHMAGMQRTYDAPSSIILELHTIEKALIDLKHEINTA